LGQTALAITDHGNMYSLVQHFLSCREAGIKPIYGVEAYISPFATVSDQRAAKHQGNYHLTLLAQNRAGLQNLFKLTTLGNTEGFYYKPLITKSQLEEHSEGVICLSGCMGGELAQAILNDGDPFTVMGEYHSIFGDNYYLEVHDHGMPEDKVWCQWIEKWHGDIPVVAANDSHYLIKEDARLHDIMLAMQTGQKVNDPKRKLKMVDFPEYYFKSEEEMMALFPEEWVSESGRVAERCNVELEVGVNNFPVPANVPPEETEEEWLETLATAGLWRKYGKGCRNSDLTKRLTYELQTIYETGYTRYFLIVADIMRWCKEREIPSSARGSAAGSLVAYVLGITTVDPIEFNLVFERFLNPGRQPDIDLDFARNRRKEVMEYVSSTYGYSNVAQIITFGTLGGRMAIRDVSRALGLDRNEADRIAKLVINNPHDHHQLQTSLDKVPELNNLTGLSKEVYETAMKLEGMTRNAGTHAAGLVISATPLVEQMALQRDRKEEAPLLITQLDMKDLEALGPVKFDFLGLANLEIVAKTIEFLKDRGITLGPIPLDDAETYEMLSKGQTQGVFQLESSGMRRWLKQLKPNVIQDLQAMVALYRPGPMEHIPNYIARKHGEEKVEYYDPSLEPIIKHTYGLLIYQESIMFIAQKILGFSMYEADQFLYAVRKKKAERLAEYKPKFFEAGEQKGISLDVLQKLWDDIKPFELYGFNEAHAAEYGVLAYKTAYLKRHYTADYMAALLSSEEDIGKVAAAVRDARAMGVEVLGPDINESEEGFTVQNGKIRWGLGSIKYLGPTGTSRVVDARRNGRFSSFLDFQQRARLNSRQVQFTIQAGALDNFGYRKEMLLGLGKPGYAKLSEKLNQELEALGIIISDHPLAPYAKFLSEEVTCYASQVPKSYGEATVAGYVVSLHPTVTKRGQPMAILEIEDETGVMKVTLFPHQYSKVPWIKALIPVLVRGNIREWQKERSIVADEIQKIV
jgi:DNA polymerase-3 subunit alpha